jgi:hypothetical protein
MSVRGSLKNKEITATLVATEAVVGFADIISRENIPWSSVKLISSRH